MQIVAFFLAGLVGISLGLIGGGGSILTVPILVYVMGLNPILATSYSLFIVGSTSVVGAFDNYRRGFVSIKTALLFGISSVITVFVVRKIVMPQIPDVLFSSSHFQVTLSLATMLLFGVLMLIAALSMIGGKRKGAGGDPLKGSKQFENRNIKLFLYGVLVGLATGFLGAGGGFLLIPALVLLLRMPMKMAVGTSLLIIALNSLIGFVGDIGHFTIDWKVLIGITLMAIAGIFAGGLLSKRIEGGRLKKAFGWFVLIMGVSIIIKEICFAS